jgi:nitrile hydratase
MNGVHDMGGMHGMGAIEAEKNEPVFHARWEARVFALNRAVGAWGKWNIDASRHQKELIPPAEYLRISYYEKFLVGMIELLVKSGLVTRVEVDTALRMGSLWSCLNRTGGRTSPGFFLGSFVCRLRIGSPGVRTWLPHSTSLLFHR